MPEKSGWSDTSQLCQEAWLVRQGPFETHFVCFLPAYHDGLHRDPEWGIWKDPEESD